MEEARHATDERLSDEATLRKYITRYVPDGFRDDDGVWHDGPHRRDALAALARLAAPAAETERLRGALRRAQHWHEQQDYDEALNVIDAALAAQPAECSVDAFSSRMCERGTKGCTTVHDAAQPAERQPGQYDDFAPEEGQMLPPAPPFDRPAERQP